MRIRAIPSRWKPDGRPDWPYLNARWSLPRPRLQKQVHQSLEDFVAELEAADWSYKDLPPDAGEIPRQAEAAVIEFNVEHCGIPDPRCNPEDIQFCSEEQRAEFEG